jgi:hypothetical protein
MKYAYILEIGHLSNIDGKFNFYDMEVYPSQASVDKVVSNMIDCNNGYGVSIDRTDRNGGGARRGEMKTTTYTYNCMSAPDLGKEAVSMRVRYVVRKMLINRNF